MGHGNNSLSCAFQSIKSNSRREITAAHNRHILFYGLSPVALNQMSDATEGACVLRGPGTGVVVDGPFTESKEALLGFYVLDCADRDAAISAARELRRANPGAMYEIRAIRLYRPGLPFPETAQDQQQGSRPR
jgi:hypothetical protein